MLTCIYIITYYIYLYILYLQALKTPSGKGKFRQNFVDYDDNYQILLRNFEVSLLPKFCIAYCSDERKERGGSGGESKGREVRGRGMEGEGLVYRLIQLQISM